MSPDRNFFQNLIYPTVALLGFFAAWYLAVVFFQIKPYLLPAPHLILRRIIVDSGLLLGHTAVTSYEVVIGFLVSVIVGFPISILIVWSKPLEKAFMPLLVFSQTVPKVAIAPLFVIWFGFGVLPKLIISVLVAFFPIVIAGGAGLIAVETEMIELIQSMNAGKWEIFKKVRIPNSLPHFFNGMKISICLSVVGAIVGEFVGSDKGLGYVIQVGTSNLDAELLFAAVTILSGVGVLLYGLIVWLEKRIIPWHVGQRHKSEVAGTP
jgi:NitT/TauT family transport system permease protein